MTSPKDAGRRHLQIRHLKVFLISKCGLTIWSGLAEIYRVNQVWTVSTIQIETPMKGEKYIIGIILNV